MEIKTLGIKLPDEEDGEIERLEKAEPEEIEENSEMICVHTNSQQSDIAGVADFYEVNGELSFKHIFKKMRNGGLPFGRSIVSTAFVHTYNHCKKSAQVKETGIFEHPLGWFESETEAVKRSVWNVMLDLMLSGLQISNDIKTALSKSFNKIKSRFKRIWHILDNSTKSAKAMHFLFKESVAYLVPAIMLVILILTVKNTVKNGVSVEIFLKGESVGTVASMSEYTAIKEQIEREMSSITGTLYKYSADVDFKLSYGKKREVSSPKDIYNRLYAESGVKTEYAYALYVDETPVAANESEKTLQNAVSRIEALAKKDYGSTVEIANDISYVQRLVSQNSIMSEDEIVEMLYPTPENDSVEAAKSIKMSEYTVSDMYYEPVDFTDNEEKQISFMTKATETYTETVPYATEYVNNDDMYEGFTKVKTEGVLGSRQVTATVKYVDGEEIGRTVEDEIVLEAPQSRVLYIGTKEVPKAKPTGTFIYPVKNPSYTSYYGWRNVFGGKSFHYGVDFQASYGTPVFAVDGGQVTQAGTYGAYGVMVKIDHGGGLETVYAHLSKPLVKVGDIVYQGQQIAVSGNSGRTTGPHLHLEVFKNGVHIDPQLYLDKK